MLIEIPQIGTCVYLSATFDLEKDADLSPRRRIASRFSVIEMYVALIKINGYIFP